MVQIFLRDSNIQQALLVLLVENITRVSIKENLLLVFLRGPPEIHEINFDIIIKSINKENCIMFKANKHLPENLPNNQTDNNYS